MTTEIIPCPFCGEPAKSVTSQPDIATRWARVSCVNIECGVKPFSVVNDHVASIDENLTLAVERWNTRKEPTS